MVGHHRLCLGPVLDHLLVGWPDLRSVQSLGPTNPGFLHGNDVDHVDYHGHRLPQVGDAGYGHRQASTQQVHRTKGPRKLGRI